MSFPQTYYKTKHESCRGCGGRAKDLFQNIPYCRTCIKQVQNHYQNV